MTRSVRLLSIAFLSASLFPAERLEPVEVTRFRSAASGIVFDRDGYAYVSHGRFISRVSPDGKKTMWAETGAPAGHKILPDGTHLVCDASQHAVVHLDADGKLLDTASFGYGGKPLGGPDDLALDPKGGFYFTDSGGTRDVPAGAVYFVDRTGATRRAAAELHDPRGVVLRPDGKTLLVAEGGRNRIVSYEVLGPGKLGPMKVFADLPPKLKGHIDSRPGGLCLDQHANLYVAQYGVGAVEVFNRKGRFIRQYPAGLLLPSHVAFGGAKMDQLFVTGADAKAPGALFHLPLPPRLKP